MSVSPLAIECFISFVFIKTGRFILHDYPLSLSFLIFLFEIDTLKAVPFELTPIGVSPIGVSPAVGSMGSRNNIRLGG